MTRESTARTAPPDALGSAEQPEPSGRPVRALAMHLVLGGGLLASAVIGFQVTGDTLWGLLPIVMYAVLTILGMDLLLATIASLTACFLLLQTSPTDVGVLLGASTAELVTQIGFIIVLGAATGEVLRVTGVAARVVESVLRVTGDQSRMKVLIGILLSCLTLVAALGTLAGALAIAAPLLIPVAARVGLTRSTTAAAMFLGGGAGLAIAPFAGSNVAIMSAAEIDYLTYLLYGAGPLALLSLAIGPPVLSWVQRRTTGTGDEYSEQDFTRTEQTGRDPRVPTAVFACVLLVSVVYAAVADAGTTFPLLALPVIGAAVGLAAGVRPSDLLRHFYRGAQPMLPVLFLFWLLAALFLAIDQLAPFNVVLDRYGADLSGVGGLTFVILIGLLGWVGVPGATAAQVVLLDEVFGSLAGALAIPAGVWGIALLWASKADTYGPFPNANMVGAMGLARSTNLRILLAVGWTVLVPACVMYVVIAAVAL